VPVEAAYGRRDGGWGGVEDTSGDDMRVDPGPAAVTQRVAARPAFSAARRPRPVPPQTAHPYSAPVRPPPRPPAALAHAQGRTLAAPTPLLQPAATAATVGAPPLVPVPVSGAMAVGFLSPRRWTDADVARLLSPATRAAVADGFGFEHLSKVQAATLELLLRGEDVFAKAKTGSGKTIAFLLPAVERLVASGAAGRAQTVGVLVLVPTRELALQIYEEACTLAAPHRVVGGGGAAGSGLRVQAVIGGTNINSERGRLRGAGGVACDVLVATPGRLVDHLDTTPGMAAALSHVRVLVLDEADRLLDMGFEPTLNRIRAALSVGAPPPPAPGAPRPPGRQTLLFSATVPDGVRAMAARFLCAQYAHVDTIDADDASTNPQVTQEALVLPATSVVPALARVLAHTATANPRHKTVVFCTTARLTAYLAALFSHAALLPGGRALCVVEMHSRKSQSARTAAAERFRVGQGLVMFSSDVSARGMDYPGITEVIQVGLTDRESYIHRLGRTARAGREGAGLLLLAEDEARALLPDLADLPIAAAGPASDLTGGASAGLPGVSAVADTMAAGPATAAPTRRSMAVLARFPTAAAVAAPPALAAVLGAVARDPELSKEAEQAYGASLGFYNSSLRRLGWDKPTLVANVNALFLMLGCAEVPVMPRDTLGKMGLRGTPGLREGPARPRGAER
jgi:ATP-dependent RNA helicase MSS116, mitochondrial